MHSLCVLLLTLALAACVPAGGAVDEGAIGEQVLPPTVDAVAAPDETLDTATPETSVAPVADAPPASSTPSPEVVQTAPPPPPEPPLLARQRAACVDEGGRLMPRGNGFFACVRQTSDGGRRCNAAADCQSLCLARSGTCAPLQPLFGCHEVFTLPDRRETLCTD